MPFLIYRDKMRAEGPNHYPYILGMALNHYKIKPKVSIGFRLQPALKKLILCKWLYFFHGSLTAATAVVVQQ